MIMYFLHLGRMEVNKAEVRSKISLLPIPSMSLLPLLYYASFYGEFMLGLRHCLQGIVFGDAL